MKVLVVGWGSAGKRHARHAAALGHEVHVHDESPDVRAMGYDAYQWHTALDAALRVRPEAVVIATPAVTHAAILDVCRKVPRLFVEKPLAMNWNEVVALSAAAFRPVAVGYQMRFHPHAIALKGIVDQMRAGRGLASLVAWQGDAGKTWPGTKYADALLECSHEIDLMLHLAGDAKVPYAESAPSGQTWNLALLHDGGVPSKVHVSMEAARYERWAAAIGNDGRYAWWGWHGPSGRSTLIYPDKHEDVLLDTTDLAYRDEMASFLGPQWTGCDLSGAMAVLRVCDTARHLAVMAHATT